MTWNRGYQGPIRKIDDEKRARPSAGRKIFLCFIMLCLIAGAGQACSSNAVEIKTELYLHPEVAGSVSQGSSGGHGGLSAVRLWTHTFPDAITAISMPADGSVVAAGTSRGEIALINSSGSVLWVCQADVPVTGLEITASGNALVAGFGNQIMMLDASGQILWTTDTEGEVNGVGISPEGNYCVAGTVEGDIILTDNQGDLLWKTQAGDTVTTVAVGPEGAFAAAGMEGGTVYLLDSQGDVLWAYRTGSVVRDIAVTAGGSIAIGTSDSALFLLDNKGRGGAVWTGNGPINAIHIDPCSSRIGVGTTEGYAHLLNGAGAQLWRSQVEKKSGVTAISFSSAADYLTTGSDCGNISYFAFTSRIPPTVTLKHDTTTPEATTPATPGINTQVTLAVGQAAPLEENPRGADTTEAVPQEAPGFSPAIALWAIAVIAIIRRISQ